MVVAHAPELVEVVQGENPDGVMMLSRSKNAGPPATARFTVSKAVIGVVAISLMVPVVPKIGSVPDTKSSVTPVHGEVTFEKAMQAGKVDTPTRVPPTLLRFTTPPPPSGMAVANTLGVMITKASANRIRCDFFILVSFLFSFFP
jgi:hypothetical protein